MGQSGVHALNDLFYTGTRTSTVSGGDACVAFAEGNVLFFNAIIMHAGNYMRDMQDTFVVLPMPKWDENQDEYYTTVSYSSSVLDMIPKSASDYEFSSAVYDALAYEGHQTVIPRAGAVVDFGMLYDGGVGLYQLPAKLLAEKSSDFASEFASIKDAAMANYEKVIADLRKNG